MVLEQFFVPMQDFDLPLPVEDSRTAAFFMKKNLAHFVWNTLTVFENNPTTLPQTEIILAGRTVSGITIDQMMQVKHFGDAARFVMAAVEAGTFSLSLETAKDIHAICGKEEAMEWGVIRKHQTGVHCAYVPPAPDGLEELILSGITELQEMTDPAEQALNTFAFMSKAQPFYDVNKRTASLLMNGVLLSAGIYPLFVPAKSEESFANAVRTLYETGNSAELLQFYVQTAASLYPADKGFGLRRQPPQKSPRP